MLRNPFRDLDQKKLSRSSEVLKVQNDYFKIVNKRIHVFSIIIVLLFTAIAGRLFIIQIRDQEDYTIKLANYSSQQQRDAAPRGEILDRNGNIIAKTVAAHNIIYFPPSDVTVTEKWELAQKFAEHFEVSISKMTNSDYQDMYIFLHTDENGEKDYGYDLLTDEETAQNSVAECEKLIRSRITKDMVNELWDEKTKEAFVVYLAMNALPANQRKTILEDVSDDDVAYLMVHKSEYRGFDVDLSAWKREYPYGTTLRDVLGSITSNSQGVPSELSEYYEAIGYSITDRVGQSGLEKQYEALLSGTPKVSTISYNETDGTVILTEETSGKKGYNLNLTIDIELQQKVDEILQNVLEEFSGTKGREGFTKAFVVLMNPNTGEIYAMSGMQKLDDQYIPYASGNYLDTYQFGSVVKGATVYMALSEGVETKDSIEVDEPMVIAGTPTMQSFHNYGNVNAVEALRVSSNVYMFKTIVKLAGGVYEYNQPLNIPDMQATISLMRQYYSMFGLGVKTGLDVPNEATGFVGHSQEVGSMLYFSIGQYDTYTPIQLAQYISTIANGGKKIQPKLVNTATEINSDYIVFENKTKILSTLSGNAEDLATVQEGFYACVTSGNCGLTSGSQGTKYKVAGKTGTAEAGEFTNASLIGYAPYGSEEPDLAFVCTAPTSSVNTQDVALNICAYEIMPDVLDEFYKKY